jgi:hypothetical protein
VYVRAVKNGTTTARKRRTPPPTSMFRGHTLSFGFQARRTSVMPIGWNATGTQLTHAMCVESTRWMAWGKSATLNAATVASTHALDAARS